MLTSGEAPAHVWCVWCVWCVVCVPGGEWLVGGGLGEEEGGGGGGREGGQREGGREGCLSSVILTALPPS